MLVTVEDVKAKLGIAADDASQDALVTSALASANERVLQRCGYSEAGETEHVEYVEDITNGRTYLTELRPVANFTGEARLVMGDFANIACDVIDPVQGRVEVVGSTGWPFYYQVRGYEWTVGRFTYDVAAVATVVSADELATIKDAVSSYAAWIVTRALARGATQQQVGVVRVVLSEETEPSWLWPPLEKHLRRTGERAEWV